MKVINLFKDWSKWLENISKSNYDELIKEGISDEQIICMDKCKTSLQFLNNKIMKNTLSEYIKYFTNEQLIYALKELDKLSNSKTPAIDKKSEILQNLFEFEKSKEWIDRYNNVSNFVKSEILDRIINNKFKL